MIFPPNALETPTNMKAADAKVTSILVFLLVIALILELESFVPAMQAQECYTTSDDEMCVETENGWVVTIPITSSFINQILPVLDGITLSSELAENSPHWQACNDMYNTLHGAFRTAIAGGSIREYNDSSNPGNAFHINDHSWPHYGINRARWGLNGNPGSLTHEVAHHVGVHHVGTLNSYNAEDICFDF